MQLSIIFTSIIYLYILSFIHKIHFYFVYCTTHLSIIISIVDKKHLGTLTHHAFYAGIIVGGSRIFTLTEYF